MSEVETPLTWAGIDHFHVHHIAEHAVILADICEQAGRDAYLIDKAMGYELLPGPSPYLDNRARSEDIPRLNAGKAYAGCLLADNASKFGADFPLIVIAKWWLMGYDRERSGL
jgi:hypothetical protein